MERKEAIEVVKKNYPHCAESGTQFQHLEHLFPNFKSEDAKIRKEIITFIVTTPKQRNSHPKWIAWLEKQGEQKPTGKVEPVFKAGDWVVNTITKEVEQIIELTGSEYICSGHLIVSYNEQHLLKSWNIEDVRDGDVLCSGQIILLFKKWESNDWNFAIAHSGIDVSGKLQITDKHWLISNQAHLATKEQRDLLFAKMKEVGYEWDAEKKELKKIPQRMVSAEAKEALYDNPAEWIEGYWRHHKIINPESYDKGEEIQFDHDGFVRFCKKYCEKPAGWSEEDYYMLGKVLECIRFAEDHYQLEDEEVHGVDVRLWLLKSLKPLKPQPHWKPSDEQMADLWNMVCECRPADQQLLQDIYYGLKTLKEE